MNEELKKLMEFFALRYSGYEDSDHKDSLWHLLYMAHKAGFVACYDELNSERDLLQRKLDRAIQALRLMNEGPAKTMAEPWSVWYNEHSGKAIAEIEGMK